MIKLKTKVKSLDWVPTMEIDQPCFRADTMFGYYTITKQRAPVDLYSIKFAPNTPMTQYGMHQTLEEVKRILQDDFNGRVRGCLV